MDTKSLFADAWQAEVEKRQKESPSFPPDSYTATGRATKEYGNKQNAKWWADNGPGMVDNWIEWRKRTRWDIWETPDGRRGIELELKVEMPGLQTPVLMYLDRVMVTPVGELVIVDLKTGRIPDSSEQLGLYATGLELTYGAAYRPSWGYFWDARKGDHGSPHNLDFWTPKVFSRMYAEAVAGVNAGMFLPHVANSCGNWCGVRRFCAAVGGAEAQGIDPLLD